MGRVVLEVNPRAVGLGIIELGGGRSRMEDVVNPAVGFVITAKPGLEVAEGQPLATVHAADEAGLERGLKTLREAIRLGHPGERVRQLPLVSWRVTNTGAERWMGDAS